MPLAVFLIVCVCWQIFLKSVVFLSWTNWKIESGMACCPTFKCLISSFWRQNSNKQLGKIYLVLLRWNKAQQKYPSEKMKLEKKWNLLSSFLARKEISVIFITVIVWAILPVSKECVGVSSSGWCHTDLMTSWNRLVTWWDNHTWLRKGSHFCDAETFALGARISHFLRNPCTAMGIITMTFQYTQTYKYIDVTVVLCWLYLSTPVVKPGYRMMLPAHSTCGHFLHSLSVSIVLVSLQLPAAPPSALQACHGHPRLPPAEHQHAAASRQDELRSSRLLGAIHCQDAHQSQRDGPAGTCTSKLLSHLFFWWMLLVFSVALKVFHVCMCGNVCVSSFVSPVIWT